MQTQRLQNQTWFIFGGTLLGSIFGLLGIFGLVLSTAEHFTERVASRIERMKKFKEKSMKSRKLRAEFEMFIKTDGDAKDNHFETIPTTIQYK